MTYINKKQKAVSLVSIALFLTIGLFPPLEGPMGGGIGHCSVKFILEVWPDYGCGIDPMKLAILWFMVLVSATIFMLLFHERKPEPSGENDTCEQATSEPTGS